ncbi:MAG: hypothetical protein ABI907_14170, partial [Ramlibacter sp.]
NSPPMTCQSAWVLSCMRVKLARAFIVCLLGQKGILVRGLTVNCQKINNAGSTLSQMRLHEIHA